MNDFMKEFLIGVAKGAKAGACFAITYWFAYSNGYCNGLKAAAVLQAKELNDERNKSKKGNEVSCEGCDSPC